MAQFDIYTNPNIKTNKEIPYLLDIQHDILKSVSTRVVVPLVIDMKPAKYLNPQFTINNVVVTMSTAELSAIHKNNIGIKVLSLAEYRAEIIGAVDFLVTGY
ncbi:MAG: CcdB family protein [Campylobacterota bacterium]|nr:CcdB family protein [Campylobacterota bacterium]